MADNSVWISATRTVVSELTIPTFNPNSPEPVMCKLGVVTVTPALMGPLAK